MDCRLNIHYSFSTEFTGCQRCEFWDDCLEEAEGDRVLTEDERKIEYLEAVEGEVEMNFSRKKYRVTGIINHARKDPGALNWAYHRVKGVMRELELESEGAGGPE